MSKFLRLLGVDVRPYSKSIEGFSYLPWALALSMAGLPPYQYALFRTPKGGSPVRQLFGGTVVAVDMDAGGGNMQRTYLPVLDIRNKPIPAGQETSRDVGDTQGRCLARAVAIVHGLGLSLYSRTEGDGASYVSALAVAPGTADLQGVKALEDLKEFKDRNGRPTNRRPQPYLGWHAAVAAARITDPGFWWEVIEYDVMDPETGAIEKLPALKAAGKGWMVGVRVHWKGATQELMLPIMGIATVPTKNGPKSMEHQPIDDPDIFHWHSAVMRCLAKAIAITTGYGISFYAGEFGMLDFSGEDDGVVEDDVAGDPAAQQSAAATPQRPQQASPVRTQQKPAQAVPESAVATPELVKQIKTLLVKTKSDETRFLAWLGVSALEKAPAAVLERGFAALQQRVGGTPTQTRH